MNFYEPNTSYNQTRRIFKELRKGKINSDPVAWYDSLLFYNLKSPESRMDGGSYAAMLGERMWFAYEKPYYKVYPAMATMMSEVSIDVPMEQFHSPYPSYMVRLADSEENDFTETYIDTRTGREVQGPKLKWIMVHMLNVDTIDAANFKAPDAEFTVDKKNNPKLQVKYPDGTQTTDLALYINYEFTGEWRGQPNQYNYTISLNPSFGTLEDFFELSYQQSKDAIAHQFEPGEYNPSKEMITRVMKLAVATAFFGIDCHEMVMPDLTRKKIEKRAKRADGDVKKALDDAKEELKGNKNWTIGREICLPRPVQEHSEAPATGRSISYSYLRRGHMRYQVYGEKRSQRKLIFIHPHQVKPELPLAKNRSHGFKIKGE